MSIVTKICFTEKSGKEIQEVSSVEVIVNKGIVNDRYFNKNNDQALQITLIESENIDLQVKSYFQNLPFDCTLPLQFIYK